MAGDGEAGEPQPPHDGDDVSRHRALGVRRVVGGRHGTAALAVAAQVRADDGEVASQPRRDLAPHEVRLGESVQQHERRPRSVHPDGELRFAGLDLELLELIHRQLSGHLTALPGSGTPRSRGADGAFRPSTQRLRLLEDLFGKLVVAHDRAMLVERPERRHA